MKNFLTLVSFTLICTSAFAQSNGLYGEVAYAVLTAKDTSSNNVGTFKPSGVRLTLGKVIAENIAVEGFLVEGLDKGSAIYKNINFELAIELTCPLLPYHSLVGSPG